MTERDKPPWRRPWFVGGAALVALLAVVGILSASPQSSMAALSGSTSVTSTPVSTSTAPSTTVGTPVRGPRGMRAMLRSVHGEFMVADGAGGHRRMYKQVGQVTEANEPRMTVKSADGFSRTYTLGVDTRVVGLLRSELKTGRNVLVYATESQGSAVTDVVIDRGSGDSTSDRIDDRDCWSRDCDDDFGF